MVRLVASGLPKKKGEREVVKPSTPNGVLQTPEQGSEEEGGKKPFSSIAPFRCEAEMLKIGDRVTDVINGFKGTVVGYKD
ncbi:MAG: hypothetical protein RLZZ148_1829, partial [Cyanobacteriota bacterium]